VAGQGGSKGCSQDQFRAGETHRAVEVALGGRLHLSGNARVPKEAGTRVVDGHGGVVGVRGPEKSELRPGTASPRQRNAIRWPNSAKHAHELAKLS